MSFMMVCMPTKWRHGLEETVASIQHQSQMQPGHQVMGWLTLTARNAVPMCDTEYAWVAGHASYDHYGVWGCFRQVWGCHVGQVLYRHVGQVPHRHHAQWAKYCTVLPCEHCTAMLAKYSTVVTITQASCGMRFAVAHAGLLTEQCHRLPLMALSVSGGRLHMGHSRGPCLGVARLWLLVRSVAWKWHGTWLSQSLCAHQVICYRSAGFFLAADVGALQWGQLRACWRGMLWWSNDGRCQCNYKG